jgi:predicted transcriptional regulator
MTTVSISLDEKTKQDIDRLAKEMRKSRSDVIRELFAYRRLERSMDRLQAEAAPILEKLGLETEEDIARYVKRLK